MRRLHALIVQDDRPGDNPVPRRSHHETWIPLIALRP
jgi:hypothetical protein